MAGFSKTSLAAVLRAAAVLTALLGGGSPASAQENTAEEAARRQAVLATLPQDAARRVFGLIATPSPGPDRPIGIYTKGCLAGGVEMPADGPDWQVMRPSRNRAWGDPALIAFLQRLAAAGEKIGWRGLLIGDMAQPRGGPMLTGHASHQLGIESDVWLMPMPDRRLTPEERNEMSAISVVAANGQDIDPRVWRPEHRKLLELAARDPAVNRIFVNPVIKRQLCREVTGDRLWLHRIRPWFGHDYHFHVRLTCPPGATQCHNQAPLPPGDGCGADLAWWFTPEAKLPQPTQPPRPLRVADLPHACAALVEPQR
ncbi:MAG: penicillin-insensitive murein endopeptidase [Alphaproteobacteria bacterium]